MTYEEQLLSEEWKEKRERILTRDSFRCTECKNRSLFDKYRIYLRGIGTNKMGQVIYVVFDKENGNLYRCKSGYTKGFIKYLKEIKKPSNSILALTGGEGVFTYLIATLILPDKLHLDDLSNEEKQRWQEEYLRYCSDETLENIKWIDTKGLHVHHQYYQHGKLAWEYPDEALITLCWHCHERLHNNEEIEIRDAEGDFMGKKKVCPRCYGAGWFPEFNHVQNGICFRCKGQKFEE